jgi:tRNA pseudouridine13 synthase
LAALLKHGTRKLFSREPQASALELGHVMKLKQQPEDFQVEELTEVVFGDEGNYSLYRLEKRGLTTLDALEVIRRRWKIDGRRVSFGGLKDRHAQTVQYFTILHGPERQLTHPGLNVEFLGKVSEAYTSKNIRGNRFRITLRNLTSAEVASAEQTLPEIRRDGVPNYFDDQRFGSVGQDGQFVARLLVQERFEDALRLALTGPYEHDRQAQKKEKAILRTHWGDWASCKKRLAPGHARQVVEYLTIHPNDFRAAFTRLSPELRSLYFGAYQSHLWNRMLARWLQEHCRPDQLVAVSLKLGQVPMHRNLEESQRVELASLSLPLPSAREKLDADDPRFALMQRVLAEERLTPAQLTIKGSREMFFSKGARPALCNLTGLEYETQGDDKHIGKQKHVLNFELARGSYATLILKRIQGRREYPTVEEAG